MTNRVYALIDPRDSAVRYVGITCDSIERRLREHISNAACGLDYPVYRWMRKLASCGHQPRAQLLEECEDRDRECFWIAHYRTQGTRLLNCTNGGDGVPGHRHSEATKELLRAHTKALNEDPQYRAKQSASRKGKVMAAAQREKIRAANTGKRKPPFTEEHRRKIGDAGRGRVVSAETRARISAAARGRPGKPHSPETRAKISAVQTGKKRGPKSPESVAKTAAALRGRKRPPEVIAKVSAARKGKRPNRAYGPLDEVTKAKIRAAKLGRKQSPEHAAKIRAALTGKTRSEEQRARISAGKKGKPLSPEHVAAMRANPPQAKIGPEQVRAIRALHAEGMLLQREIAGQFGIQRTTVADIIHGRCWSHVE